MEMLLIGFLIGVSYGMVLFMIALGLSVLFGFMGVIQLAHGAVFMMAGFIGVAVANSTGNFLIGILAGSAAGGVIGLLLERGVLRFIYRQPLSQVLVTLGFIYIIVNVTQWIFGSVPVRCSPFSFLSGSVPIWEYQFPIYRLIVIGFGLILFVAFFLLEKKSRIGAVIRAGMDDPEMVSGLGVNLRPFATGTFVVASLLAGLAAMIAAPMLGGLRITDASAMGFIAVAVVVVGGVGSVEGSLLGALIIGVGISLATMYVPALPMFAMYLIMVLILLFKPLGILGRKTERKT